MSAVNSEKFFPVFSLEQPTEESDATHEGSTQMELTKVLFRDNAGSFFSDGASEK